MESLESQAQSLGIPMRMEVHDDIRQEGCDAHMADLLSIEGKHAVYQGECAMGHEYKARFLIEEIAQQMFVENGQLVMGQDKGYDAEPLEEY